MVEIRAVFLSRDELGRGLTALYDAGIREDQVEIREQRPKTGESGFEYVDDEDRGAQVRMTANIDATMAATGDTLVGSPAVPTTDTKLGDLLAAMVQQEDDEQRPEYLAGTRYELTVRTDDPAKISKAMKKHGAREIRTIR